MTTQSRDNKTGCYEILYAIREKDGLLLKSQFKMQKTIR